MLACDSGNRGNLGGGCGGRKMVVLVNFGGRENNIRQHNYHSLKKKNGNLEFLCEICVFSKILLPKKISTRVVSVIVEFKRELGEIFRDLRRGFKKFPLFYSLYPCDIV